MPLSDLYTPVLKEWVKSNIGREKKRETAILANTTKVCTLMTSGPTRINQFIREVFK